MALAALIPVMSASELEKQEQAAAQAEQNKPVIQGLASHVKTRWESARDGKREAEERILKCIRQRNGEYDPDKLAAIRQQGGSEIYMQLSSTKARGAAAWLRDALLGTGADRPWQLEHTPIPDLPPEVANQAKQALMQAVEMFVQTTGQMPTPEIVKAEWERMRDEVMRHLADESQKRIERMELKMEDQLLEGHFTDALSQFIDDIVTFPTAILKGPVPRKRKVLKWQGAGLATVEEIRLEWERVNPLKFYPASWAADIDSGPVIEIHDLTRDDIDSMIGVEGFSDTALRQVLRDFDTGGLSSWLAIETEEATSQGKSAESVNDKKQDTVEALQLWDHVQGSMLVEWGMDEKEIADPLKSYPVEVWMINNTIIKAVLNYDPLGRKPYYAASWERVPGAFWGNGVLDLIRDCQDMCNAAARSLSNNMGISSGPQVGVNVARLPSGESITKMYPWKIWQFGNSDFNDGSKPLEFFQPNSNANELMAVFEKFSQLADEYSGIPRYMMGEHAPGVGRTSSGLAMLISNASKSIKSVISNIDQFVIKRVLDRLYQHNMRYSQDPDLIGDVNIVPKGAMSLVAREAAAVRRNEFLQLVLNSPVAAQIVGMPGTAELLRENARLLDLNVDKIVPPQEQIMQMLAAQAQQQAMMMALSQQGGQQPGNGPALLPDGTPAGGRESNLNVNRATGQNK